MNTVHELLKKKKEIKYNFFVAYDLIDGIIVLHYL